MNGERADQVCQMMEWYAHFNQPPMGVRGGTEDHTFPTQLHYENATF